VGASTVSFVKQSRGSPLGPLYQNFTVQSSPSPVWPQPTGGFFLNIQTMFYSSFFKGKSLVAHYLSVFVVAQKGYLIDH
jgi:hypothetical protein